MNSVKTVLAAAMNGISIVVFALSRVIVWHYAIVMAVAAIAGGYLGARMARRMRAQYVRVIVVLIGFAVALYSWWSR